MTTLGIFAMIGIAPFILALMVSLPIFDDVVSQELPQYLFVIGVVYLVIIAILALCGV